MLRLLKLNKIIHSHQKTAIALLVSLLLLTLPLSAQSGQSFGTRIEVLRLESLLSQDAVRPGDTFRLGIKIVLLDDWHINSSKPSEDFLIATTMEIQDSPHFEFGDIQYPPGHDIKFEFSDIPLSVYEDSVIIWLEVTAASGLQPGEQNLTGKINYQACNNSSCLAPTGEEVNIVFKVVQEGQTISEINRAAFEIPTTELGLLQGERQSSENEIDRLMQGRGLFLTLVFIFLGGLALNLTPCVYPIIPITVSFFVGQAGGRISRSFALAITYVLGMAITYSTLGVLAAMTGGLLGASLQNPLVLVIIALIFLVFAASMFGAFEIRIPAFLNRLAGGSKQGYVGSLFMGLTVGIVAAPCIGPFVLSLLTYVAAKGEAFTGFILFFVLSAGLGLPYLFLGTFSSSIQNLPRSGEWMVWVKKVFGFIMIAMAVYFVSTLIPEMLYIVLLSLTLISGGLIIGFIDKSQASFSWFSKLKAVVGIMLMITGLWQAASAWQSTNAPGIDWQPYQSELVAEAAQQGKPVIIDFYADWCIPCKQLDKTLFSHPDVVEVSKRYVTLKADLTKEKSEETRTLRRQYKVMGVPTIVFVDRKGMEIRRFTDELVHTEPEVFMSILEELLD